MSPRVRRGEDTIGFALLLVDFGNEVNFFLDSREAHVLREQRDHVSNM